MQWFIYGIDSYKLFFLTTSIYLHNPKARRNPKATFVISACKNSTFIMELWLIIRGGSK